MEHLCNCILSFWFFNVVFSLHLLSLQLRFVLLIPLNAVLIIVEFLFVFLPPHSGHNSLFFSDVLFTLSFFVIELFGLLPPFFILQRRLSSTPHIFAASPLLSFILSFSAVFFYWKVSVAKSFIILMGDKFILITYFSSSLTPKLNLEVVCCSSWGHELMWIIWTGSCTGMLKIMKNDHFSRCSTLLTSSFSSYYSLFVYNA